MSCIGRLALSVAVFACVGCSDDDGHQRTPSPTVPRTGRPTRTELDTPVRSLTPTPTGGDAIPTPTTTAPATPGTATITPTVSATPTPTSTISTEPLARLRISSAFGSPGMNVTVDVALTDVEPNVLIAGTQNDIAFDPGAPIAATAQGRPMCSVNPAINKLATSYAFQPFGCIVGTNCTGIRALVLSLDNVDPIPPGSVLYTCTIAITAEAASSELYPLACSMAAGSTPDGGPIALECEDGEISVAASGV